MSDRLSTYRRHNQPGIFVRCAPVSKKVWFVQHHLKYYEEGSKHKEEISIARGAVCH